ncbi:PREDICTED: translation initiation factor IF-2-like [Pseudopodoces humilis]|uniref:translation initiation factor IF-2-like n=1 Tax=Pseudopodoces humilis TaxID=181119 RepID=UPI0006B7E18E|nr:PREDICTED: translation initiation factor IF-2-like [Pseudopodoces humilis]
MKRETPCFSPSALKPAPPTNLRLCFPDCRPPAPQQDNRTDGRTDGAGPARPGGGGGRRGSGGRCWVPPAHSPAGDPGEGCLGILFFSLSLPVRSLAAGAAPAGRTPMAVGEALTPTRLWPAGLGDATITSTAPQPCAPHPSRPPERRGEKRRGEEGATSGGDPTPAAPASPPAPASAVAPAPRSLSPPSQKQRDSLSSIFYLIDFHFLHKTSNCKYF